MFFAEISGSVGGGIVDITAVPTSKEDTMVSVSNEGSGQGGRTSREPQGDIGLFDSVLSQSRAQNKTQRNRHRNQKYMSAMIAVSDGGAGDVSTI